MIQGCAFFRRTLPPQDIQRNSAKAAHNGGACSGEPEAPERRFHFTPIPKAFVKSVGYVVQPIDKTLQ